MTQFWQRIWATHHSIHNREFYIIGKDNYKTLPLILLRKLVHMPIKHIKLGHDASLKKIKKDKGREEKAA